MTSDLSEKIERFGWVTLKLPGSSKTPNWSYTLGLWKNFQVPELCLFGLGQEHSRGLVQHFAEETSSRRLVLPDPPGTHTIGPTCFQIGKVHDVWMPDLFGVAAEFYQGRHFPMRQILWPDRAGAFPTEPSFDSSIAWQQPVLGISNEAEAGLGPLLALIREKLQEKADLPLEGTSFLSSLELAQDAVRGLRRLSGYCLVLLVLEEDPRRSWGYTVGLPGSTGVPDFALFGLGLRDTQEVLVRLAETAGAGQAFPSGPSTDWVFPGSPTELRELSPDRTQDVFALRDPALGPLMQLTWADRQGLFPGQEGFEGDYQGLQPEGFDPESVGYPGAGHQGWRIHLWSPD